MGVFLDTIAAQQRGGQNVLHVVITLERKFFALIFYKFERGPITEVNRQLRPTNDSKNISGFRYKDHTYQPLNLALDIEAGSITYHLSSEFVGDSEMSTVIDTIELERSKRNST